MKQFMMALLGLVIFTTTACKKERANVDTRVKPVQVRLKEMIVTYSTYKNQYLFRYDTAGYVIAYYVNTQSSGESGWTTGTRVRLERDALNRTVREIYSSEMASTAVGFYRYNSNNELMSIDYYMQANEEGLPYMSYTYKWLNGKIVSVNTYAHNGQLVSMESFSYNSNGNVESHRGSIYPGNMVEVRKVRNAVYDDKPNYIHTLKGLNNFAYIFGLGAQALSNNNLVYNEREWQQGKFTGEEFKLTYNKYGYVEKEVRPNGNQTREFIYEEIK